MKKYFGCLERMELNNMSSYKKKPANLNCDINTPIVTCPFCKIKMESCALAPKMNFMKVNSLKQKIGLLAKVMELRKFLKPCIVQ